MKLKSLNNNIYILISFIILLLTNNYFTYEQSLVFGARDGFDYYTIANEFKNIEEDSLSYHKAWRFILPFLVGFISNFFDLDIYLTFRIFVIIASLIAIFLFNFILTKLKIQKNQIFFLNLFFIFNPYLFRYFIANPTMLNDLVFTNSALFILLSYTNNDKKLFYFGLLIGLITRQNAIFYIVSIILVKIIFKKESFFKLKDVIFSIILTFLIFYINTKFASTYTIYNEAYSFINRLNLFLFNYSINEFLIYNLFFFIITIPIISFIIIEKKIFIKNIIKTEFYLFIFLLTFFICAIAYVGGPVITGKNLIRLCNLVYPLIILIMVYPFKLRTEISIGYKYIYSSIIFIWSLHPKFSSISIFKFF